MTSSTMKRSGFALVAGFTFAFGTSVAYAVPVATKDVSAFDYVYDFEETPFVNPTSAADTLSVFDLYNNTTGAAGADGVSDFTDGAGSNPVHSGGVLSVSGNFFNNTWAASNQQTQANTVGATGYTIEYRVRVSDTDGGTNGSGTYMVASDTIATGGFRIIENTGTNLQEVYYGAVNGDTTPEATVAAGEFMTIRIVAEPDVTFGTYQFKNSMYVNDVLVASDESITFANGAISGRLIFGNFGGGYAGLFEMDSLAWTEGAFAPIPEPATLSLAALGAGLVVLRRRRR